MLSGSAYATESPAAIIPDMGGEAMTDLSSDLKRGRYMAVRVPAPVVGLSHWPARSVQGSHQADLVPMIAALLVTRTCAQAVAHEVLLRARPDAQAATTTPMRYLQKQREMHDATQSMGRRLH